MTVSLNVDQALQMLLFPVNLYSMSSNYDAHLAESVVS